MAKDVQTALERFYRIFHSAIADSLPAGPSEYQKFKIRRENEDMALWKWVDQEIATHVTAWPEWSAILNQTQQPSPQPSTSKPHKGFNRYGTGHAAKVTPPEKFGGLNARFDETTQTLLEQTQQNIREAIEYSLQRLEQHPDYQKAVEALQSAISFDKLSGMEEALPLLDACQPSRLNEEIVSAVLERTSEYKDAIRQLGYPYDQNLSCRNNVTFVMRIQSQIVATYRDKFSRLLTAAENQFQRFLVDEVLRGAIGQQLRDLSQSQDFLKRIVR